MSVETTVVPLNGHGFRLVSGVYALVFEEGRLQVARRGAVEGIAFATLGGRGWNVLPFIHQRRVGRTAGRPQVTLVAERDEATFLLAFDADPGRPGLFHWRFAVTPRGRAVRVPLFPEIAFTASPRVTLYTQQAPMAAGLVYLYEEAVLDSTLFYFQDLTALNDYFAATRTGPTGGPFPTPLPHLPPGIVGYREGGLGLALPGAESATLPVGATTVVSEGYLALTPGRPEDELAMARRFLESLAAVYGRIAQPETALVDWVELARRTVADLPDPRNWVEVEGRLFLRAYVNDERTVPELIPQLDVLTSLRAYCARYGHTPGTRELDRRLSATLSYFYSPEAQAVLNRPLSACPVADSWYFITGLVDLCRLARAGDRRARRLLVDSVERAISVARWYDYIFPVFFDPTGATHPPQPDPPLHPPCEYDVAGAYAYLMLDLYEEAGGVRYLEEARAAVEALQGHGFDLAYELHVTALAATACARLSHLTGEPAYIELSLIPLANLLRHCWLWECAYGYAEGYRTFFGLLPMTYARVITPKEQYEAWQSVVEYLRLTGDRAPEAVRMLLAEFCRHTLNTMRSSFAPLMPAGSVAAHPRIRRSVRCTAPELYIPLEDIRDGWEQSGHIAQELYGAGMALTFAASACVDLRPGLVVYGEYPLVRWDGGSFTLGGTPSHGVEVALWGAVGAVADDEGRQVPLRRESGAARFRAWGGRTYRIRPDVNLIIVREVS